LKEKKQKDWKLQINPVEIVLKGFTNTYGSGFFAKLSKDMKKQFPEIKSFSVTNLHYMKWYYELYPAENNLPQLGVDSMELIFRIPWGQNKLIIDKCKNNQKAMDSCEASGNMVEDHFANVGKMIKIAKGAEREVVFSFKRYLLFSFNCKSTVQYMMMKNYTWHI